MLTLITIILLIVGIIILVVSSIDTNIYGALAGCALVVLGFLIMPDDDTPSPELKRDEAIAACLAREGRPDIYGDGYDVFCHVGKK